jgi:hypothetical protein
MLKYFIALGVLCSLSIIIFPLGLSEANKVVYKGNPEGIGKLQGDMNRSHVYIHIVAVPWSEIRELCKREVKEGIGCARWDGKKKECWIWIPEPIGLGDGTAFQVAGHELWHCKIGNYHK